MFFFHRTDDCCTHETANGAMLDIRSVCTHGCSHRTFKVVLLTNIETKTWNVRSIPSFRDTLVYKFWQFQIACCAPHTGPGKFWIQELHVRYTKNVRGLSNFVTVSEVSQPASYTMTSFRGDSLKFRLLHQSGSKGKHRFCKVSFKYPAMVAHNMVLVISLVASYTGNLPQDCYATLLLLSLQL